LLFFSVSEEPSGLRRGSPGGLLLTGSLEFSADLLQGSHVRQPAVSIILVNAEFRVKALLAIEHHPEGIEVLDIGVFRVTESVVLLELFKHRLSG
jgi:hypothetical protein